MIENQRQKVIKTKRGRYPFCVKRSTQGGQNGNMRKHTYIGSFKSSRNSLYTGGSCGTYNMIAELFAKKNIPLANDQTFLLEILSTEDGHVLEDYDQENKFLNEL